MNVINRFEAFDKIHLGEEDYIEGMEHIVRPRLQENRSTGYFQSFDGTRIYYEGYYHTDEKAAVVISHGFCEFTAKFEEVIYYFFEAGYSVYILDHRGHGYSGRNVEDLCKVHIHSYEDYVRDFHEFIMKVVLADKRQRKLVLYAHSMGGAIGALYLEQYPNIFTCAILSSPMLSINFGLIPAFVIGLFMRIKKRRKADEDYVPGHGAFDGAPIFKTSSCLSEARYKDIFTKRSENQLYQTYGASCAWTLASLEALHRIERSAKLVKTPTLILQAGKDTTVKPGGQLRFAKKSGNTRLVLIPESKHEIYNATTEIRKKFYHNIFGFLEEVFGYIQEEK